MQINITGTNSKRLKAVLSEAAEFFANQLMDPRMVRDITLDIDLYDELEVNGECVNEDDTRRSRWFTINLKKDPKGEDILQVLAHEMVHVKQYAKNELSKKFSSHKRGKVLEVGLMGFWMGEQWNPKRKEDPYFDAPWEIEAYGREVGLIYKWHAHKEGK